MSSIEVTKWEMPECFTEFHHCYSAILNDDIVTDERMWHKFDDEY